ncbi:IS21-like element helper ATPase IstB [Streptomyces pseudovenezuelae]|uniref:IS21-like element helper ATPase IstB n=1 Tax=Streptomyces pseudovenezuelae TaxID=67350 RepID=UPI0036E95568
MDPRPGPQDLTDDDIADGWTDQLLFQMVAALMPGARAVLRRITKLGGTASYEDVQHHFAEHPTLPIPPTKIGGTLTSVKAVQRRTGPDGAGPLLQRDEQARRYRIDDVLVAGLQRAFALAELLMAECEDRDRRRAERRIRAAHFPREKSLREFDYSVNPNVDPAVVNNLATCEWIAKDYPLCLIGDSGTGKSHLLIALGTTAAMAGYRVRYTTAAALVNELVEAADDKQLGKTIGRYGRVDLLEIDELGYLELDRRGAEMLFQVLTEREEESSIAIASNEAFTGWSRTFTDPRLCAAIVDRLTFNASKALKSKAAG